MILQKLNARGITIVLVTHDTFVASYGRRQIKFHDGRVAEDLVNSSPLLAQEQLLQNGHTKKNR
jgi:putative ABC transport system ATP-binding protein